jgi:hypothetical protein
VLKGIARLVVVLCAAGTAFGQLAAVALQTETDEYTRLSTPIVPEICATFHFSNCFMARRAVGSSARLERSPMSNRRALRTTLQTIP